MLLKSQIHKDIPYVIKGDFPKLLVLAGTHGDEYETTEIVSKFITDNHNDLPEFLFIPQVSPSATHAKTRKNSNGVDIAVMEIIASHGPFNLAVSFHEDLTHDLFYIYDSQMMPTHLLSQLKTLIQTADINLYTGIDDPQDEALGHHVQNGYISLTQINKNKGTFSDWALSKSLIGRSLVPEVPGTVPLYKKQECVSRIFHFIIENQLHLSTNPSQTYIEEQTGTTCPSSRS